MMIRKANRFSREKVASNPNCCCKNFLAAFEMKYASEKDGRNGLFTKYEYARRQALYYQMLYEWLQSHPEWEKESPAAYEDDLNYSEQELEAIFAKHLQYGEAADYIKGLI